MEELLTKFVAALNYHYKYSYKLYFAQNTGDGRYFWQLDLYDRGGATGLLLSRSGVDILTPLKELAKVWMKDHRKHLENPEDRLADLLQKMD